MTRVGLADDVFRAAPAAEDEREVVVFPLVPQASQRASERRKKLFAEAIQAAATQEDASRTSGETEASSQTSSGRSNATTGGDEGGDTAAGALPQDSSCAQDQAIDTFDAPVIEMLRKLDIYNGQIVHVERLPARPPQFRGLEEIPELDGRVVQALTASSVQQLYSHQFEAIQAILAGKNIVLSTSTASGKSLAYNVPMANMLLADPSATFIYMFPTKVLRTGTIRRTVKVMTSLFLYLYQALAQDQLKALRAFLGAAKLSISLCSTFVRSQTSFSLFGVPVKCWLTRSGF